MTSRTILSASYLVELYEWNDRRSTILHSFIGQTAGSWTYR